MNDAEGEKITYLFEQLDRGAKDSGYNLNPDTVFTLDLVEGLQANQDRYGYMSCPCRLASGKREEDLDIICPCDYRDPDLTEFGACYCTLYVSDEIASGAKEAEPVPERRLPNREDRPQKQDPPVSGASPTTLSYPVWRCRVCGYLTAMEEPPNVCPICKVTKDRFERFM